MHSQVKLCGGRHVGGSSTSIVTSAFQITFRAKIYVNDVFSFFKNYFWHQHIKTIQNIQIILNFNKKKILIFLEHGLNRVPKRFRKAQSCWGGTPMHSAKKGVRMGSPFMGHTRFSKPKSQLCHSINVLLEDSIFDVWSLCVCAMYKLYSFYSYIG
jgi:hypothetical protein